MASSVQGRQTLLGNRAAGESGVKSKDPVMVAAGKKAAATKKRNAAALAKRGRAAALKAASTRRANLDGAQVALSLRQPLAELIMRGKKRKEFRSVPTSKRERIYIYAAKQPHSSAKHWKNAKAEPGDLPAGVIVGTVEITDCVWDESNEEWVWTLARPRRFTKPLVTKRVPTPIFFRPF